MLDKKQIDQLFLEKLRDYEKDPPVFLWNNIEKQIHGGKDKINFLTFIAIAAAVLTLFLSGWWLSSADHSNLYITQFNTSETTALPGQEQIKAAPSKEFKPSAYSMATFAPTTSFSEKKEIHESVGEEPVPSDLESKFISKISSDEKLLKKIKDLISPVNSVPNADKKEKVKNGVGAFNAESKERKWNLRIQAGPVFTGGIKKIEGLRTHPENTVTAGIIAEYNVTKKLSVESGLVLNQIKQQHEIINSAYSNQIITPSGKVNVNELYNSNGINPILKQELNYVSIPVLAHYKIIDKKFKMGVSGGINANLLTGNEAAINDNRVTIHTETTDIREVTLSGELGLELGYEIGKRITFTIEPHIKQYLNSLSSNSAVNFKPFQAGLITGVSYSFN
jgi:hypothetical protein